MLFSDKAEEIIQAKKISCLLREKFLEAHITLATFEQYKSLFSSDLNLDELLIFKNKLGIKEFMEIRKTFYRRETNLIINMAKNSLSRALLFFTNLKKKPNRFDTLKIKSAEEAIKSLSLSGIENIETEIFFSGKDEKIFEEIINLNKDIKKDLNKNVNLIFIENISDSNCLFKRKIILENEDREHTIRIVLVNSEKEKKFFEEIYGKKRKIIFMKFSYSLASLIIDNIDKVLTNNKIISYIARVKKKKNLLLDI